MGRKRNSKYDQAYTDYMKWLSLSEVAETIAVSRQCVFKAFKKKGLQLSGETKP